jgi:hypothetical protein
MFRWLLYFLKNCAPLFQTKHGYRCHHEHTHPEVTGILLECVLSEYSNEVQKSTVYCIKMLCDFEIVMNLLILDLLII